MNVEVIEETEDISSMVVDELSVRTKIVTITTPDIINGRIKCIEVKNEKFHSVNLKFTEGMQVDEHNPTPASNNRMDKK